VYNTLNRAGADITTTSSLGMKMLRTAEGEDSAAVWRTAARCEQSWWKSEKKPPKYP